MSKIRKNGGRQEPARKTRLTEAELDRILSECTEQPVTIPGTPYDLIDVLDGGRVLVFYREWDRDAATVELGIGMVGPEHPIAQHPTVRERARANDCLLLGVD